MQDLDSIYARGPERLFVLAQRLVPEIVDRAISTQMPDERVRDYLKKSLEPRAEAATASRQSAGSQQERRLGYEIFHPAGVARASRLCATAARSAVVVDLSSSSTQHENDVCQRPSLVATAEQTGDAKTRIDVIDADAIAREASLNQESGLSLLRSNSRCESAAGEGPAPHDRTMRRVDHHATTGSEHAPRLTEGSRIRHEVHHVHRKIASAIGADERQFAKSPRTRFETAGLATASRLRRAACASIIIRPVDPRLLQIGARREAETARHGPVRIPTRAGSRRLLGQSGYALPRLAWH